MGREIESEKVVVSERASIEDQKEQVKNYKGFVAGVFSGIAKLTGQSLYQPLTLQFYSSDLTTILIR